MGRTRENQQHQHFSPWCDRVLIALERKGLTNGEFAKMIGFTEFGVHSMLTGRTKPPIERLRKIASALGLTKSDADEFVIDGQLAHCPRDVRSLVGDLQRKVTALTIELGQVRSATKDSA